MTTCKQINTPMQVGKEYALLCYDEVWRSYKCQAISNGVASLISTEGNDDRYVRIKDATFKSCESDRCAEQEMADFIHKIIVKYELSYEDQNEAWELISDDGGYYAG